MAKILTFGEIIWDVYGDVRHIGGAGLNFAAHAAKCGAESYLMSAVGQDGLGDGALAVLSDFGVSTDFVSRTAEETGACLVRLDGDGKPTYNVLKNTAYDNIPLSEETIARIRETSFHTLYFGTLIQRSPVSRASLRRLCEAVTFEETVCDLNLREGCYDKDSILFCLTHATLLKISDEEEPILRTLGLYKTKNDLPLTIATAITKKHPNIKTLLLTRGEKGCLLYSAERKAAFFKKAEPVTVASTVGAGDSFLAGFVTARQAGHGAEEAARFATLLSGFVVSHTEAVPPYRVCDGKLCPDSEKE